MLWLLFRSKKHLEVVLLMTTKTYIFVEKEEKYQDVSSEDNSTYKDWGRKKILKHMKS